MDNKVAMIFEQYVKDLKMSATEQYVYVVRDDFFGDIVFTVNSTSLSMMKCPELSDKYFGKMIYADFIRQKTIGFETEIGILDNNDFITLYNCRERFNKSIKILNQFKFDIQSADKINQKYALNEEEDFFNNVLTRKADEGAGRYIFNDNIMYTAPCMFPGSKTTGIDVTSYYKTGNDYYISLFNTHKKTGDVVTLMRFLCL
jgi:hypothetical protein